MDKAYHACLNVVVNAHVFDSPTILYYARHEGEGSVSAVGPPFDIEYVGVLFPQGSDLRETVNRALLKMRRNGICDKLHRQWFGA